MKLYYACLFLCAIFIRGDGGIVGDLADQVDDKFAKTVKTLPLGIGDTDKRVQFVLYNEKKPDGMIIILNNIESLRNSSFDPSQNTLFFAHGWFDSSGYNGWFPAAAPPMVRDAFLKHGNFNVVIIDWGSFSHQFYGGASLFVKPVGKTAGKMIDFLVEEGQLNCETLIVAGHSLGSHVAGQTARNAKCEIPYLVDPSGSRFFGGPGDSGPSTAITKTDARYVEMIHTTTKLFGRGKLHSGGHLDFYVNGGFIQKNCFYDVLGGFCSHIRAVKYWAESINAPKAQGFWGRRCGGEDYNVFKVNFGDKCNGSCALMGTARFSAPYHGSYYVPVSGESPWMLGESACENSSLM